MTNPFDNPTGTFVVLVNDEGEHSLWSAGMQPPAGWSVAHASGTLQSCVDYVNTHWTDMRPRTLLR